MLAIAILATTAQARVFYYREQALALAFPEADKVDIKTIFLNEADLARVKALGQVPLDSRMFSFYVGQKAGKVIGYAAIDSHTVRTLPEAFMVVLTPEGEVQAVHILAFYEPLEYLPPISWLRQFVGKSLTPDLRLRRDIQGISGATLSVGAITAGVRKILALHRLLIEEK